VVVAEEDSVVAIEVDSVVIVAVSVDAAAMVDSEVVIVEDAVVEMPTSNSGQMTGLVVNAKTVTLDSDRTVISAVQPEEAAAAVVEAQVVPCAKVETVSEETGIVRIK